MTMIDRPCDNRCRHRGAPLLCSLSLCPLLYSSSSCPPLCLVICSGGLHRLVSSTIVAHHRAHRRIRCRCHWKLEDGCLVEESNVGIHGGGGGGDKGADSLWMPGLTTVEVDKVRRDNRKRGQPKEKPADFGIGYFLFPLERYGATRSISGKRNFSVAVRHTQPLQQSGLVQPGSGS
jgi:hypothetical protein